MLEPVIALDIGGTKIAGGIVDSAGRVFCRKQIETPVGLGGPGTMEVVIDLVQRLHTECPVAVAVGVGSAGQIDHARGRVIYANENLPGWTGMEIRAQLEAAIGLSTVVDNDVNAMAVAEARQGAAAGHQVVIVVAIGTGIGGALMLERHLFRGATGIAGEIGHIPVASAGPRCACGKLGCLEAYTAGPYIAAEYARRTRDPRITTLPEVVQLARHGDRVARAVFARAGTYLGCALAGLVNVLNPDAIVIGGGVMSAEDLLLGPLQEALRARVLPAAGEAVSIYSAALGTNAGLIGAALLAREALGIERERGHVVLEEEFGL